MDRAAVVVASDRCARGETEDRSGRIAVEILRAAGLSVSDPVIVPDGVASVESAIESAIVSGAQVVITSGGTGVGPRDKTPEATRPLLALELPGLAEAIRRGSGNAAAALSRGLAGVTREGVVIVNVAGSPAAVTESLGVVVPLLPHIFDQLQGGSHG